MKMKREIEKVLSVLGILTLYSHSIFIHGLVHLTMQVKQNVIRMRRSFRKLFEQ
jgi:hypothetical protein